MTRVDQLYRDAARRIMEEGYSESAVENACVRATWGEDQAFATYLPQEVFRYKAGEVPLINLRRIAWKSAIKEILWIYKDRSNDVDALARDYGVKYWDAWKKEDGSLGTAYGYQMAKTFVSPETGQPVNQVSRLVDQLRHNPLNRRLFTLLIDMDDLADMALIPCAFMTLWTVTGNKLNMTLIQRSGDFVAAAGPGSINAFQYYALLRMVAQVTGYEAGDFVHFIQNLHIYDRHMETVKGICEVDVEGKPLPKLVLNPEIREFEDFTIDDFTLENYEPDTCKWDIPVAV